MENHEAQSRKIRAEIYAKMSPSRKYHEVLRLRETAWALKRAGLRIQHPDWTPEQIETAVREIFLYAST